MECSFNDIRDRAFKSGEKKKGNGGGVQKPNLIEVSRGGRLKQKVRLIHTLRQLEKRRSLAATAGREKLEKKE